MTTPAPDSGTPQGSNQSGLDSTQNVGSAQAQRTTELRNLAMALAQDDSDRLQVLKGTVVPGGVFLTSNPQTLTMQLSGDSTVQIAGVRFLDSYTPTAGDTVLVVKCGGELFALGKFQQVRTHAANGWVEPALASGWTRFDNDPLMYRMVVDHGSSKIQLRGRATVSSGTPSTVFIMPSGMRPLFNLAPILVARGFGGGSTVAQIDVISESGGGAINLVGATVTPGAENPSTGGPSTNNTSWQDAGDGGSPGTFNNGPDTGFFGDATVTNHSHWVGGHQHNMASHTHTVNDHTHPVTFPDFISFNGVEYFI